MLTSFLKYLMETVFHGLLRSLSFFKHLQKVNPPRVLSLKAETILNSEAHMVPWPRAFDIKKKPFQCTHISFGLLGITPFIASPPLQYLCFAEMGSPLGFVLWCIVVISCLVAWASAGVHFSSLPNTLGVIATINSSTTILPNVAMAGIDEVVVSWWVKQSSTPVDSEYRNVKVKLCFAPVSQVDRAWRKTNDDLKKDKTCQFDILEQPYNNFNTTTWTVKRDVPKGTYFVRAYALNAFGSEVAYGQSTNKNKTSNLFMVEPISGRHVSLDITTVVFSAFSIVSLFGFFIVEKWSARRASQKN